MDWAIVAQQLTNGLVLGASYGLIAVGYTMVYGIIGMINFAHGDVYMVSAYLTAIFLALLSYFGVQHIVVLIVFTLLLTAIITGVYGWAIERTAYKPLRQSSRLAPLISAIGVSLVLQNFVQLAQGAENKAVPTIVTGFFRIGSDESYVQISNIQILILVFAVVSMLGLHFLVNKTALGRSMRATQQDRVMAEILGINTGKIIPVVFVIGAVMASVAGMFVTLNYGAFDFFIGFIIGIKAFTAAVLGGIGSLPGAMLGGILLGMSESLFSGFINTDYKDVFAFSLLVLVLIFRPSGLLGKPVIEKV